MNFKASQYLVLATGTDIGKTFFVTKTCRELLGKDVVIEAIKPVASGFRDGDMESDSVKILQALGREINEKTIAEITPWRFAVSLAPSLAARYEAVDRDNTMIVPATTTQELDFLALKNFCLEKINSARTQNKFLLIEGAGGVMTPLNSRQTFLDLAASLKIPILLIGGNYLGSISHVLCAVEALKSRDCMIEKIIINDFGNKNPDVKIADTIAEIRNFCEIEVLSL